MKALNVLAMFSRILPLEDYADGDAVVYSADGDAVGYSFDGDADGYSDFYDGEYDSY